MAVSMVLYRRLADSIVMFLVLIYVVEVFSKNVVNRIVSSMCTDGQRAVNSRRDSFQKLNKLAMDRFRFRFCTGNSD
jgi:hypothetical protein